MIVTFETSKVRELISVAKNTKSRRATFAQHYDPSFWRDDLDPDLVSKKAAEIKAHGYTLGVTDDFVDQDKIPASLWLIGNKGIYLTTNASPGDILHSRQTDPALVSPDQVHIAKDAVYGRDNGFDSMLIEQIEALLNGDTVVFDITGDGVSIQVKSGSGARELMALDTSSLRTAPGSAERFIEAFQALNNVPYLEIRSNNRTSDQII